jgi:predicted lipoprotein
MPLTVPVTAAPWAVRLVPALSLLAMSALVLGAAALNGPLVSIRALDPITGKVVFSTPQNANAQGQNQKFALNSFDAAQYVEQQWPNVVEPLLQNNAADLATLLAAIAQDPGAAAERYGPSHQSGARQFVVKGRALVAQADLKSPLGLLTLGFPDSPGLASQKVQLLTGPLVISTALRDVMPDMTLNSFTNQTQYADVAAALNNHALKLAYAATPAASLAGKRIQFTGVFSLQSPSSIRIVPVALTVEP